MNPIVTFQMQNGKTFKAELYPDKAPNTVNNFLYLVNKGYYNGVIFHRVIAGFMIQGGDPDGTGTGGPGYHIKGEFSGNGFTQNDLLHELVAERFPRPWDERHYGWRVAKNVYLEYARMFEWPDSEHKENEEKEAFCYALRNQFGVLVDGTVVPCCLDHAGDIPLGNLFEQQLDEILASPRARAIYDGFTRHVAVEPLCRRCGYSAVIRKLLVRGKE